MAEATALGVAERMRDTALGWFDGLMNALPRVALTIVLVVGALILASVIRKVLRAALVRLHVDDAVKRVGIDDALRRMGVHSLSEVLPKILYFVLLFVFAGAAADALGLDAVAQAIGSVLDYLPNVAAAMLLLFFGMWAAQSVGSTMARVAQESGLDFGPALGRVVSGAITFVFALTAISQLKIDTDIVRLVTACALAGMALAFGLSVGLGTRDFTRNLISGFYARKVFRSGDRIEVRDAAGTLRGITATQTLIETEQGMTAVPNTVFLEETVRAQEAGDDLD